ncbi:endonuclease [Brachyspira murdochii]|uniref:endonuclease n=1 Tax=Brachyspira murdochii TaxID=84378 RepID=UPI003005DD42
MSFIDKHNANKKLSIYTSIVSFILGCIWVFVNLIWRGRTVTKEEAIAVVIILLGLNAVSFGSDLRGFLKILKGGNEKEKRLEEVNKIKDNKENDNNNQYNN